MTNIPNIPEIPSNPTRRCNDGLPSRDTVTVRGGSDQPAWVKVAGGAGVAMLMGGVGFALTSFAEPGEDTETAAEPETPWWSDGDLTIATTVTDSMSFSQAFAAARAEVGAGGAFEWHGNVYSTYYVNEWNSMSRAEQHAFNDHFQWNHGKSDPNYDYSAHHSGHHSSGGHTASHHHAVDENGMTFAQAYASAREQVGPGGVFEWNGKLYNTYNREEWHAMSAQDKHEFAAAVSRMQRGEDQTARVETPKEEEVSENRLETPHGHDDPSIVEPEPITDPEPEPEPYVINDPDPDPEPEPYIEPDPDPFVEDPTLVDPHDIEIVEGEVTENFPTEVYSGENPDPVIVTEISAKDDEDVDEDADDEDFDHYQAPDDMMADGGMGSDQDAGFYDDMNCDTTV